ncbi:MAG: LapA family protein [Syntrophomonadaceae bacterium]
MVFLLIAMLFLLATAIFVFQNNAVVTVQFLHWSSPELLLAVVILVAVFAGSLIAFFLDSYRFFRVAKRIRVLYQENEKLQRERDKLLEELNQMKRESSVSPDQSSEG